MPYLWFDKVIQETYFNHGHTLFQPIVVFLVVASTGNVSGGSVYVTIIITLMASNAHVRISIIFGVY